MRGLFALPILLLLGIAAAEAAAAAAASRSGTGRLSRSGTGRLTRSGSGRLSRSGTGILSRSGTGHLNRSGTGRWSRSGTGRLIRVLEENNLLLAHEDQLVMGKRYYARGANGYPFHMKTKSGIQEGRVVITKLLRSLPWNKAEESLLDKIRQKIIEQAVLQALAMDLVYTPNCLIV